MRTRRTRLALAAATTCALCAASLTTASADEDTPTRAEVEAAKDEAAQAARDVGAIKAELATAEQNVIDLGVEAGRMAEAYNGAIYKLHQARRQERKRVDAAAAAKRQLDRTIARMSTALAANASRNSDLENLSALLEQNGPQDLLNQVSGNRSIDDALSADLQKYDARKQVYELLAKRSARAVDRRESLADEARAAKAEADAAVATAEDAAAGLRAKRGELISELAKAQGVSKSLVRQRQRDLREQAQQDAIDEAQQEQEQQDTSEEPPEDNTNPPDDGADDSTDGGDDSTEGDDSGDNAPDSGDTNTGDTDTGSDEPETDGNTEGDNGPDDSTDEPDHDGNNNGGGDNGNNGGSNNNGNTTPATGVNRAISFAKAQLGEPYVYGAAGPSSWDCSGLTMMAWAAAGKSLPHWSVAQYQSTTPVSMSSIRRGDLLFWSNGSSSSIYHVAMYLGNGMMIQAPRPGKSVEIVSMYYWILPDLAGRV